MSRNTVVIDTIKLVREHAEAEGFYLSLEEARDFVEAILLLGDTIQ